MKRQESNKLTLNDGSSIAVVGGGPAGSFYSYFALDFAERFGIKLNLEIIEPKNFHCAGPKGCNHCGGIVSESLIQMLSGEGIVFPSKVIRNGIESYTLHLEQGSSVMETPFNEQKIASMFRGIGPLGIKENGQVSFDNYLLDLCLEKGATLVREKVTDAARTKDGIILTMSDGSKKEYDLVVGAVGLNKKTLALFKNICPALKEPAQTKTYISEFHLGKTLTEKYIGDSMHVFLLNVPKIKFGAIIPKGDFVTLVLLGKNIKKEDVHKFLQSDTVKKLLPSNFDLTRLSSCQCYPSINTRGAKSAYDDRVILIGDSASSKLYKNGIGAAYTTGKAAATTSVFMGISRRDFKKYYRSVCRELDSDNAVGKFIFWVTGIIQKSNIIKLALLNQVIEEQKKPHHKRMMSSILWDTFTGSTSYKNIFTRCLNPNVIASLISNIFRSYKSKKPKKIKMKGITLGRRYRDGEIIIKQGDVGDCLYVVQSGKVELIYDNGQGEVRIAELGSNEFFGEMGLFERDVRSCTVRACGEAKILTIDRRNFYKTIHKDPTLAYNLLQKMSYRIREINKKLA
ncbi:MAG: cyclic nucleotide-binding domain-containing protein [Bacteroidales bacterium]|nr:cyclic nucleotide-binding domain-containing protein [Bacteroidales bacterium]